MAQAIATMIAAEPDVYLDKFNFRSEICISCDWRHLELGPRVCAYSPGLDCTFSPDCGAEEHFLHQHPSCPALREAAACMQAGLQ